MGERERGGRAPGAGRGDAPAERARSGAAPDARGGPPFASVLIANRGEIAVRVARTLRRLGIESVAVFSDADADAPHVRAADRALRLGPASAAESYLNIARVVDAALRAGAEAIHPGYGFLSERPDFARACVDAGLTFVGPSPEAMALLGDKVAAKEAAAAAGVPVVPGLGGAALVGEREAAAREPGAPGPGGAALTDDEIVAWVETQELPLLLKAAAGGGGKGMRVVHAREELNEALAAARREARAAFGDDRLLVERYLERPRHIEVQVIGDQHGTVIHLGERECSLQRRHQKVIEEAPSPVVGAPLRQRMGEAAVALARGCGYANAGTVELIADRDDPSSFYFLEMNARLQVEHPVTEAITGLDLVELQLRVAAGEPLPLTQEDVRLDGHAIEARLYAEDPANGFLPSTGRVVAYREPAGPGLAAAGSGRRWAGRRRSVRIDSGIAQGTEVTSDYDPMLAKVIAHGPDRATALARLDHALRDLRVLGPTTNAAYLRALLARPEVRAGELDTTLIERLGDEIAPPPPAPELPAAALVALLGDPPTDDPWDARDGWRLTRPAEARMRLEGPAGEVEATARPDGSGGWWLGQPAGDGPRAGAVTAAESAGGAEPAPRARRTADGLAIEGEGGVTRTVEVEPDGDAVWLIDDGVPTRFAPAQDLASRHAAAGSLEAPMPGVVLDVRTQPGAQVQEGDVLVVLESMKMELAVQAPADGVVADVLVSAGERVTQGAVLVALADPEDADRAAGAGPKDADRTGGAEADDADRAAGPEPEDADRAGGAGPDGFSASLPPEKAPDPATGPARSSAPGPAQGERA